MATENLQHAHRLPSTTNGEAHLRVIAADDFSPVENIEVQLVFAGVYRSGGLADGGQFAATTDSDGIASFDDHSIGAGPFQIYLVPPSGTRYCHTQFTDIEDMLICQENGVYFPSTFRIAVRETTFKNGIQFHLRGENEPDEREG